MKKKLILECLVLGLCTLFLGACGGMSSGLTEYSGGQDSFTKKVSSESKRMYVDVSDCSTWDVPNGASFLPLNSYVINDGSTNGLKIVQFVDVDTGVIWVMTSRFFDGYGMTFDVKVDKDGNPCVFENVDALIDWYKQ